MFKIVLKEIKAANVTDQYYANDGRLHCYSERNYPTFSSFIPQYFLLALYPLPKWLK